MISDIKKPREKALWLSKPEGFFIAAAKSLLDLGISAIGGAAVFPKIP
jgi:hypothetical protein